MCVPFEKLIASAQERRFEATFDETPATTPWVISDLTVAPLSIGAARRAPPPSTIEEPTRETSRFRYLARVVALTLLPFSPFHARPHRPRPRQRCRHRQPSQSRAPKRPRPRRQPILCHRGTIVPLKLNVVVSRYQNDKKVSSLPYSISANATGNLRERVSMRTGAQVPYATTTASEGKPVPGYSYRDVGISLDAVISLHEAGTVPTGIDCRRHVDLDRQSGARRAFDRRRACVQEFPRAKQPDAERRANGAGDGGSRSDQRRHNARSM